MDASQQPSPKQQVIEAVRSGESIVITTSKSPSRDEIAAAIGLRLLLEKLDKVAEVVIAAQIPAQLDFLPTKFINSKLQGQRDFVIEVDQSQTEADHLKYVTEDGKLKIYVTPYNGVYSEKDVSFSYGDYHCDVIIGLGAHEPSQLDPVVTQEKKLTDKARFVFITNGSGSDQGYNWVDAAASSICEMVMSMSEALGSGMMDKDIATALFAGIVDKTEHFTNSATTPKVMTMAAQLLAAGANQAEVVKKLSTPAPAPATKASHEKKEDKKDDNQSKPGEETLQKPSETPSNEFQIRRSKAHQTETKPAPKREEEQPAQSASVPEPQPQPEPTQAAPPAAPAPGPAVSPAPPPPPQPPTPPTPQPIGATSSFATPPPPQPVNPPPSVDSRPAQPPAEHPPSAFAGPNEKVIQPPKPHNTPLPPITPAPNTADSSDTGGGESSVAGPASVPEQAIDATNRPISAEDLEAARRAVEEAHGGGNTA